MKEVMTNSEAAADAGAGSEWDILRPEQNGIGDFPAEDTPDQDEQTEEASSTTEVEEANPSRTNEIKQAKNDLQVPDFLAKIMDPEWELNFANMQSEVDVGVKLTKLQQLKSEQEFWKGCESIVNDQEARIAQAENPESERRRIQIDNRISKSRILREAQEIGPDASIYTKSRAQTLLKAVRRDEILLAEPELYRKKAQEALLRLDGELQHEEEHQLWVQEVARGEGDANDLAPREVREILAKCTNEQRIQLQALEKAGDVEGFQSNLKEMLIKIMGMEKAETALEDVYKPEKEYSGYCRKLGDHQYLVAFNTAKLLSTDPFRNLAKILPHELYHCYQHENEQSDHPMSEVYNQNFSHYIRSEVDYDSYRSQYVERTAFLFSGQFYDWLYRTPEAPTVTKGSILTKLSNFLRMRKQVHE